MADIELVIKLDEEYIKQIDRIRFLIGAKEDRSLQVNVINAIKNGTPLPKGHGDIIDRNKIEYMRAIHDLKWGEITASECATRIKYSAPTIIEMDKEQEDGNDD